MGPTSCKYGTNRLGMVRYGTNKIGHGHLWDQTNRTRANMGPTNWTWQHMGPTSWTWKTWGLTYWTWEKMRPTSLTWKHVRPKHRHGNIWDQRFGCGKYGIKQVGHGNPLDQTSWTWKQMGPTKLDMGFPEFILWYVWMRWHDKSSLTNMLGVVLFFVPESCSCDRLLDFSVSDSWNSTFQIIGFPHVQIIGSSDCHSFFGFSDFILWMFLYEMNSQEFLDNCLVFLFVLVSCSCEECKMCFFTYYKTQEHVYAHPGTFSEEAKAFILGILFCSKAFRTTLR